MSDTIADFPFFNSSQTRLSLCLQLVPISSRWKNSAKSGRAKKVDLPLPGSPATPINLPEFEVKAEAFGAILDPAIGAIDGRDNQPPALGADRATSIY
jgi:hypothetical protein